MNEEFDRFEEHMANDILKDESHLPVSEQSLVFRLRKRAEIRRQIPTRKSVEEGKSDRIADLLEEAANEIERLTPPQPKKKCSGCGTTKNLHADYGSGGPWRCASSECMIF